MLLLSRFPGMRAMPAFLYSERILAHRIPSRRDAMRRCCFRGRKQLGGLLALGGVLIIFVCLPVEFILIAVGVCMTAVGLALLDA